MTIIGILSRAFASMTVPSEGVRPPRNSAEQSSTRSAPPRSASSASSREPQQISNRIVRMVYMLSTLNRSRSRSVAYGVNSADRMAAATARRIRNVFTHIPSSWASELLYFSIHGIHGRLAITDVAGYSTWEGITNEDPTALYDQSHRASQTHAVGQTSLSGRRFHRSRQPP